MAIVVEEYLALQEEFKRKGLEYIGSKIINDELLYLVRRLRYSKKGN